jgi:hypothetical protein
LKTGHASAYGCLLYIASARGLFIEVHKEDFVLTLAEGFIWTNDAIQTDNADWVRWEESVLSSKGDFTLCTFWI